MASTPFPPEGPSFESASSTRAPSLTSPPSAKQQPSFLPDPHPWPIRSLAYQFKPGRGIWDDLNRRAPYYASDFSEGFRPKNLERVVGATVRLYFLNLIPALAYTLDMNYRTGGNYGVNESVLVSAIAALTFSIIGVQPLTIVGVTGLTNLFFYTTFDIMDGRGVNFLQFQAWVLIWSAITHWLTAILNVCDYTRFVTDMTSETFGLYVGVIYIQKGIELLILEFATQAASGWFSVVVAILFALFVYHLEKAAGLTFGPLWARKLLKDYAFAACIILFTGFVHIPGQIKEAKIQFLPITKSFSPSTNRAWVIKFWELPVKWIFVALPFGCLVTLLFYFDNNVSSIAAQSRVFPVKRPAGFHWDFFLLGCTTFISGILGLPAPNGLVPQAPMHTEALCDTKLVPEGAVLDEEGEVVEGKDDPQGSSSTAPKKILRTRVVEQRISHLAIGLLTLGTMTRPLLVVLGLMSRAMFAGVFLVVGWGSVEGSGIVHKTLFLLRDSSQTPFDHPLLRVKRASIVRYLAIQWFFFAAIVAISETIAGIGFPVIITILIPVRHFYVPRIISPDELAILDAPTANSAAVLVSLGGPLSQSHEFSAMDAAETGFAGSTTKEKVRILRRRKGSNERRTGGRETSR